MSLDSPEENGWNKDLAAEWYDIPFPVDISEVLFDNEDETTDDDTSSEEESEEDESDSD